VPAPGDRDHVREASPAGDVPTVIVYADFECPYCAAIEQRLVALGLRLIFRHFPVRSSHPRAWPAAGAAEAAGHQGRFWEMHDLLFADQAHLEDPHLWERAQRLGLDIDRFDADRRSEQVIARIDADFRAGVRAGVVTTPTLFTWAEDEALATDIGRLETFYG
jgi:protein-disulfide isomerase